MKLIKFIKKWFKNNQQGVFFILSVFFVWQILVAGIIFLGERFIPTTHQYLYIEDKKVLTPRFLWSRANFDGLHYLGIAGSGYGLYQQAFFPFYPYLIRLLSVYLGGRSLIAGLIISWLSFLFSLFFFYRLIRLDWEEKIARRAIFYLLLFPTAFFFSMVYTESLFLLLVLGSFYFARTKRWWLAGVLGAFASATRLPGVFLLPALGVEFWQQRKASRKPKRGFHFLIAALPLFLIPLGLFFYMHFLQTRFHDPLMFLHVQPYFGAGRVVGKIILLYQVFWRYIKMLITVDKLTPTYFVVVLEALTAVVFLILTIFVYLRRWFAEAVFMGLVYITPTLTGTFSSLPRYVLVLFPGFILLALWAEKYKLIRILYPVISLILFIISLIFFTRGYWIA